MAQTANPDHKATAEMAESRIKDKRQEHRGDNPQPGKRRDITAEEKERIRELYQAGVPVKEIASQFPYSRTTIEYLIPVCRERRKTKNPAPVVRIILLPGMEKHVIGKRRGWKW